MSEQLNFAYKSPLVDRFEAFHKANPHVCITLVNMCREYKRRDHADKIGARSLVEALRWDWRMKTTRDASQPKINNDYSALYARKIMEENPDLAGIFEIRRMVQV